MRPNPQENLVTLTEEVLNRKLHFLCSEPVVPLLNSPDILPDRNISLYL